VSAGEVFKVSSQILKGGSRPLQESRITLENGNSRFVDRQIFFGGYVDLANTRSHSVSAHSVNAQIIALSKNPKSY